MRISTNMMYELGTATLQRQQAEQVKLQQHISSGRRVLTPSDDPVAAASALDVSQARSLNDQYHTNAGVARDTLALEESALADATSILQDVKTLAVSAGNPTLTNANKKSLAAELEGQYQELLAIANRTDAGGQYLFSGYRGSTRPFGEIAPGTVAYAGDSGVRNVQIGASRLLQVSDAGDAVFRAIRNGNGTFDAAAGAGNAGSGVIGPGTVTDTIAWNAATNPGDFTIKFSQNMSFTPGAGNTVGGATAAGGIVNQAQWNAGSRDYTVVFTAPNAYDIQDTATGNVIQSGAYVSGAAISFNGAQVVVTDGAGPVAPAAGDTFRIVAAVPAGSSYDIIDNVNNVSVLTGLAPGTAPYPRTYVPGGTIALTRQAPPDTNPAPFDFGASVTIDGVPGGGDTFTVKASTDQDVFTTLHGLLTALGNGTNGTSLSGATYQNALNSAMSNIDNALDHVVTTRARVGARLKEVDVALSTSEDLSLAYNQSLSRLQDLDYAKALSEFAQQQTQFEAAQKSFVTVTSLDLFKLL